MESDLKFLKERLAQAETEKNGLEESKRELEEQMEKMAQEHKKALANVPVKEVKTTTRVPMSDDAL